MSRRDGTNQFDQREMKWLQQHPQVKDDEKYPNLVGRAVHGFKITFEDGTQIEHGEGLATLYPMLVQKHGKIKKTAPIFSIELLGAV